MSNCVDLKSERVDFKHTDFDVEAFKKLASEHTHEEFEIDDWFCWFIKHNHQIHTATNASYVTIQFGRGKSSHTWRDFEYVLKQLDKLMLPGREIKHVFLIRDEFDGFKTQGTYTHVFKKEA